MVNGHDIRTEIILMADGDDQRLNLVVGSAGLNVAKDSWPLWPGVVYPNIVTLMAPGYACPHLMFTTPGTFPELNSYQFDEDTTVHWLQAIPIHESERLYWLEKGPEALEGRGTPDFPPPAARPPQHKSRVHNEYKRGSFTHQAANRLFETVQFQIKDKPTVVGSARLPA